MQSVRSFLASFVSILVLVSAGCQKSGDSTPPAAAISASASDKAGPQAVLAEAPPARSEYDLLHPLYEFETSQGKFTVRLDAEKAPLTVDNFHNYVARGHYDSTIFHQVLKTPVQIVLAGGYTADLREKAVRTAIRNEAHNGLKNHRGTIAMARRGDFEDSATCQFFINLADNDVLNFRSRTPEGYGYCVFGEVTDGMEVVDRIAKVPLHDTDKFAGLPVEAVVIKLIRQVKQ